VVIVLIDYCHSHEVSINQITKSRRTYRVTTTIPVNLSSDDDSFVNLSSDSDNFANLSNDNDSFANLSNDNDIYDKSFEHIERRR